MQKKKHRNYAGFGVSQTPNSLYKKKGEDEGMSDNELLLAISEMMDAKLRAELQPIKDDIKEITADIHNMKLFQENVILPRLDTIESCYTDTYKRYKNYADRMQSAFEDIDLLKKVVSEHSEKLQRIS